jgi:hypothetical protein
LPFGHAKGYFDPEVFCSSGFAQDRQIRDFGGLSCKIWRSAPVPKQILHVGRPHFLQDHRQCIELFHSNDISKDAQFIPALGSKFSCLPGAQVAPINHHFWGQAILTNGAAGNRLQ